MSSYYADATLRKLRCIAIDAAPCPRWSPGWRRLLGGGASRRPPARQANQERRHRRAPGRQRVEVSLLGDLDPTAPGGETNHGGEDLVVVSSAYAKTLLCGIGWDSFSTTRSAPYIQHPSGPPILANGTFGYTSFFGKLT